MSDCTGPRPHDLPLVVNSKYTHPSEPPPMPALPLGAWSPPSPMSASTCSKNVGWSLTNLRSPMSMRSSSPSATKTIFTGSLPVTALMDMSAFQ